MSQNRQLATYKSMLNRLDSMNKQSQQFHRDMLEAFNDINNKLISFNTRIESAIPASIPPKETPVKIISVPTIVIPNNLTIIPDSAVVEDIPEVVLKIEKMDQAKCLPIYNQLTSSPIPNNNEQIIRYLAGSDQTSNDVFFVDPYPYWKPLPEDLEFID